MISRHTYCDLPMEENRNFDPIIEVFKLKVRSSKLDQESCAAYLNVIDHFDPSVLYELRSRAVKPLASQSMMYLCAFMCGFSANDIALVFGVEIESVYRIKYRIKHCFPEDMVLPF